MQKQESAGNTSLHNLQSDQVKIIINSTKM